MTNDTGAICAEKSREEQSERPSIRLLSENGSNIFGDYAHYGNLSFSRYINRKSYWKVGISYLEKPYDYAIPQQMASAMLPTMAPNVSASAPRLTARRMASSKLWLCITIQRATGTVPWQVSSKRFR